MSDIHSFAGGKNGGAESPHRSHPLQLVTNEGGNTLTVSFEGTRAELFEKLKSSTFFKTWDGDGADAFPEGGSTTSEAGWSYPYLTRAIIRRTIGPVCQADFVVNQVRIAGIWGLDFAEISKPILAWYKPGTAPKDNDENNRPDVAKIRAWMKLGEENPASPDYAGYKVDGTELAGATLTLAKMIYRGVESFSVYAPVVTWQCRLFDPPDIGTYPVGNRVDEIQAPHRIKEIGNKGFLSHINNLSSKWTGERYIWVRSGSKVATNPDATYMWTMQFLGVEKADEDLYPKED